MFKPISLGPFVLKVELVKTKQRFVAPDLIEAHLAKCDAYLAKCDEKLEELEMINDSLQGRLEATPKPSELL